MCVRYILRLATCDFNFAHIFWQIGKKLLIYCYYQFQIPMLIGWYFNVIKWFLFNSWLMTSQVLLGISNPLSFVLFSRLNYYTLSDLYFFNCYGFLLLNVLVYMLVLIIGRSAKSRQEVIHYILHSIHK